MYRRCYFLMAQELLMFLELHAKEYNFSPKNINYPNIFILFVIKLMNIETRNTYIIALSQNWGKKWKHG